MLYFPSQDFNPWAIKGKEVDRRRGWLVDCLKNNTEKRIKSGRKLLLFERAEPH